MPIPSTLSLGYDAVLSTTLFNYQGEIEDQISTSLKFFYMIKKEGGGYIGVDDPGDRMAMPLMYELAVGDTFSGYDTLPVTPTDGLTMAFYDWCQLAIPISISYLEERKNSGAARISSLLKAKTEQAVMGINDLWSKMIIQGEGSNDASTAGKTETQRVSPSNGSIGTLPLALVIKKDPSTTAVGNIDPATNTWWRNQQTQSAAATYAAFKKELRKLNNDCAKGPGGPPNVHLADQATAEYYEEVLSASHRNPSYQRADLPFDSIGFRGKPVVWEEFMPNWMDRNATQVNTKGSWVMINSKFWQVKYDKQTNFDTTEFTRPQNQAAKVAHIMWLGAVGCNHRRKQGVLYNINTTVVA